jgi:hypothetical protein
MTEDRRDRLLSSVLHTAKPHAATDRALALLALRPLSVALDPSDAGMARIVPDSISLTTHIFTCALPRRLQCCRPEPDSCMSIMAFPT